MGKDKGKKAHWLSPKAALNNIRKAAQFPDWLVCTFFSEQAEGRVGSCNLCFCWQRIGAYKELLITFLSSFIGLVVSKISAVGNIFISTIYHLSIFHHPLSIFLVVLLAGKSFIRFASQTEY